MISLLTNTGLRASLVSLIGAKTVCIVCLSERGSPLLTIEYLDLGRSRDRFSFVFAVRRDEHLVQFFCISCGYCGYKLRKATMNCGQLKNCSCDVLTFLGEEARSWARSLAKPRPTRLM